MWVRGKWRTLNAYEVGSNRFRFTWHHVGNTEKKPLEARCRSGVQLSNEHMQAELPEADMHNRVCRHCQDWLRR